jgi:hypothetical protein
VEDQDQRFAETISQRSRMTPCPRDVDLRNDSRRRGEREHLQNNVKAKPEQLKLNKTYTSI